MRKLIICLFLFGVISTGHSQILLKEAKVDYKVESMKIDPNTNSLVVEIKENYAGDFQKDPLDFMRRQFNIQKFIVDNEDSDYDSYLVNFKSNKGYLAAKFDGTGDLVSSFQKFKNIALPESARLTILEKHRDAAIVGNKYYASTKGWDLTKSHYIVKIKDGDKTRRVRVESNRGLYTLTSL
jgi:hypothetical protein